MPSEDLTNYLQGLLVERGIREVVVGVPKTLAGGVGFQAREVLDTIVWLKREFPGVRFVEWDERLTTRLAAAGRAAGTAAGKKRGGKKRRGGGPVDHLAAARMLQEYLGARGNF